MRAHRGLGSYSQNGIAEGKLTERRGTTYHVRRGERTGGRIANETNSPEKVWSGFVHATGGRRRTSLSSAGKRNEPRGNAIKHEGRPQRTFLEHHRGGELREGKNE